MNPNQIEVVWLRKYRKPQVKNAEGQVIKPSRLVHVYGLKGTPEQHAEYKTIKDKNYIEDKDSKQPLFFSPRFLVYKATKITIVKNKEGKDYNIQNEELEMLNSLTAEHGLEIAERMMSDMK